MNIPEKILKKDEKSIFSLRALYEQYGYKKYKMTKFEEYGLYAENKNFLLSDNIITFNDNNGKLMALKPDVTLSIVKNTKAKENETQKVYYHENVYRMKDGEFKELQQVGVEYIGEIDMYSLYENIVLAKKSLDIIDKENVLDISHIGIISGIMSSAGINYALREEISKCLKSKNEYDLLNICNKNNIEKDVIGKLIYLTSVYGTFEDVLPKIEKIADNDQTKDALRELHELYDSLKMTNEDKNIRLDFSVINDLGYYNGLVFQGFIKNIPCAILSGGRYDNLISKFKRRGGAVGFALYMDLIDLYIKHEKDFDTDVVITYKNASIKEITDTAKKYMNDKKTVTVVRAETQKTVKSKETVNLD